MVFFVFWSLAMWVIKLVGGRRRSLENSSCEGDAGGAVNTGQGPFLCRLIWIHCPRHRRQCGGLRHRANVTGHLVGDLSWSGWVSVCFGDTWALLRTIVLNGFTLCLLFSPMLHPPRDPCVSCTPDLNTGRTKLLFNATCRRDKESEVDLFAVIQFKKRNWFVTHILIYCMCLFVFVWMIIA